MSNELEGRRIAFLATHGAEQVELTKPWDALAAASAALELISIDAGRIGAMKHLESGDSFAVDTVVGDADVRDYDGLVLPGGVANPGRASKPTLRMPAEPGSTRRFMSRMAS